MPKLTRKRAVLAKIEGTYGTDPTPTGSANAILVKNLEVTPLAANVVSRDLIRAYLGEFDQLVADKHVECSFEVEIAGSGTAGDAPAYGPLLRACGMSETVDAGVDVVYSPISASFESVTIYYNVDGILHKITGARGTVQIDITAKQIPVFKFKFVGIYNAPTDTALPSCDYSGFVTPLVANNTNTSGFSFFGVSTLVLSSLTMDVNNVVDFRSLIGSEYTQITDRRTMGELNFEAPALATFNAFSTALATATGALSILHGTTGGNKVQIDAPAVDVANPSYVDDNGVTLIKCPVAFLPESGNDEFTITVF